MVQTQTETQKKTKKSSKGGRVNAIGNFIVDKVVGDVMRSFIAKEKIKGIDTAVDDEQLAVALSIHFQTTTASRDDLCKCDGCGGEGPAELAVCPFCGVDGDMLDDDDAPPLADASSMVDVAPAPESEVAPTKTKKKTKTKETTAMTTTTEASHTNGKAMTTKKGDTTALVSTTDLDKAVSEVIALKASSATATWELGQKILEINKRNLWKLRKGDDGKARYSSFDAFVHAELMMTPTLAWNFMSWAKDYSAEDVAQIGRTKLALLMKAPPEDRKALESEIRENGLSKEKLAEKVKEAKKKRGYEGATPAAKRGSKGAKKRADNIAAAKKDKPADKITIASIEGRKTVKLYAKPATLRNLDMDALKPAKTIEAQPFGRMELANEVVMYFNVQKAKDGRLQLVVETRREAAADDGEE